ncbi:MAG: metallophosphoesterase family protein [Clostridia bacterium]|nr:metallophosphoesterase family protein [Clostridia bacterium]
MKIMFIADEADKHFWDHPDPKKLEGVELILSCGDIPSSYLSFLTCYTSAPILYVHGNHDTGYIRKPPEGCICVEDTIIAYKGIRIMGLGGSMRYKAGPMQYNEKQMARRIKRLKPKLWMYKGVDILVTHAPAFQLGDGKDLCHTGFRCFREFLDDVKPQLMVHGHVHQSYTSKFQRVTEYNSTKIVNACGSFIMEVDRVTKPHPVKSALSQWMNRMQNI